MGMKLRVPQKERVFLTFIVINSFLKEQYSKQLIISFIKSVCVQGGDISLNVLYFSMLSLEFLWSALSVTKM
jgi:hypothetical protein